MTPDDTAVAAPLAVLSLALAATLLVAAAPAGANGHISISFADPPETITLGEELAVDATLRSSAAGETAVTLNLSIGGETVNSTRVAVPAGGQRNVTLTWTVANLSAGSYGLKLSGAGTQVTTGADLNRPPEIELRYSPTRPNRSEEVTVEADVVDIDGQHGPVDWTVDGVAVNAPQVLETTFDSHGDHVVTASSTDDDGATGTTSVTITVAPPPNQPPSAGVITVGGDATRRIQPNRSVTLRHNGSDPDGQIVATRWYVDGEEIGALRSLDHRFTRGGDRTVRVVVTDDDGASANATRNVTVGRRPTAGVAALPTDVRVGDAVELRPDADATGDPDGTLIGYRWLIDGDRVSENGTTTVTFDNPGDHTVTLAVTDNTGLVASDSVSVSVAPAPGPANDSSPTPPTRENGQPGLTAVAAALAVAAAAALHRR